MRKRIEFYEGDPRGSFIWVSYVDSDGNQNYDRSLDTYIVGLCNRTNCQSCWELPEEFQGGDLTVDLDLIERRDNSPVFVAHTTEPVSEILSRMTGSGVHQVRIEGSFLVVPDPEIPGREILVGVGRIRETV